MPILILIFTLITTAAAAQNPTCPTRPAGDSTNACASTAFVHGAANCINLTGDVTSSCSVTTIAPNAVTNAKSAQMASGTVKCNSGAVTANPSDCSGTSWFDRAYCSTVGYLIVRMTGAWTCSPAIPLDPVWWGADPTGVADSTSAWTNMIAAAPTPTADIRVECGTYLISSVTYNKSLRTYGAGPSGTNPCAKIKASSATATVFPITSDGVTFEHLGFTNALTRTSGGYIYAANSNRITVRDFYMEGYFVGVWLNGVYETVRDGLFLNGTGYGTAINGAGIIFGDSVYTEGTIDNVIMNTTLNPATNWPNYGILCKYCDVVNISNSLIIHHTENIAFIPGNGQTSSDILITNTTTDTAADGLLISPAAGGSVVRLHTSNMISTAMIVANSGGGRGVVIDGSLGTVSDISIEGGSIEADVYPWVVAGAQARVVLSGIVTNNNTNPGGSIGWTCSTCRIENNIGYNPVGGSIMSPGASPWTHVNNSTPETLYCSASTQISGLTVNGNPTLTAPAAANVNVSIDVQPNQSVVFTYTGTLACTRFIH